MSVTRAQANQWERSLFSRRILLPLCSIAWLSCVGCAYQPMENPDVHARVVSEKEASSARGTSVRNFPEVAAMRATASAKSPSDTDSDETIDGSGVVFQAAAEARIQPSRCPSVHFGLDGLDLTLQSDLIPSCDFQVSSSGDFRQMASAVTWNPYREITVEAIPYGVPSEADAFPTPQRGNRSEYRRAVQRLRRDGQRGNVRTAQSVELFGVAVEGDLSRVDLALTVGTLRPTLVAEWISEAGGRLWIVRIAAEIEPSNRRAFGDLEYRILSDRLSLSAVTLAKPTTVQSVRDGSAAVGVGALPEDKGLVAVEKLPTPSWWNGDCDSNRNPGSYRFKDATYRGMPACGPTGTNKKVNFGCGPSQGEWQCTELSKRYLYTGFNECPFLADGKDVVENYPGSDFSPIANGTANSGPIAGDVLSYGAADTEGSGHTSVVTSSKIDSNGNGSISVIEQNASKSGTSNLNVSNWYVSGNFGAVSGWLHQKVAAPPPAQPSPNASELDFAGLGNGYGRLVRRVGGAFPSMSFSGDGMADLGCRDSTGKWWWIESRGTSGIGVFVELPTGTWCSHLGAERFTWDYDGDGKTDLGCRDSAGSWYWWQSRGTAGLGQMTPLKTGFCSHPGAERFTWDFDGDGKTDLGCRDATGKWWWIQSLGTAGTGAFVQLQKGSWCSHAGAERFTWDFDGDGKTDLGCRDSSGKWYWIQSLGLAGTGLDVPLPTGTWCSHSGAERFTWDYDGDGKTDLGCRDSAGSWYWWQSRGTAGLGPMTPLKTGFCGHPGAERFTWDFDGDGKTDLGCRDSTGKWWWIQSRGTAGTGVFVDLQTGTWCSHAGAERFTWDFDGDGKTDLACRDSAGSWYWWQSRGTAGLGPMTPLKTGFCGHPGAERFTW